MSLNNKDKIIVIGIGSEAVINAARLQIMNDLAAKLFDAEILFTDKEVLITHAKDPESASILHDKLSNMTDSTNITKSSVSLNDVFLPEEKTAISTMLQCIKVQQPEKEFKEKRPRKNWERRSY